MMDCRSIHPPMKTIEMPKAIKKQHNGVEQRQGGIIPLVAVVLLALLVIGGVAIDSARLQLVKSELRAAADCVARSAANELALTDSQTLANLKGKAVASTFRVGNAPFQISDSDIQFGRVTVADNGISSFTAGAVPPNSVRVAARRETGSASGSMAMLFGSMFGVNSAEIESDATAGFRCVDICFVLDRSTSMKLGVSEDALGLSAIDPRFMSPPTVSSRWQALDRAVDDFVDQLKKNKGEEKISIVTYGSDLWYLLYFWPASTINLGLTSDLDAAKTEMSTLSSTIWNGNTYIEKGMRDAISVLTTSSGARVNAEKVMIVLTDGVQNVGECRNAATSASALGITVHTVTFSDYADQVTMVDVANIGNGSHAHADDEATLKAIMKSLAAGMTSLID